MPRPTKYETLKQEFEKAELDLQRAQMDLASCRASHAKLMRGIKKILGYRHWEDAPIGKDEDVVDGALHLLRVTRATALREEKEKTP